MTVSYQYDVASSSTGGFFRLLWRWRGSIWKLLYKELILFIMLYVAIALSYDYLMSEYTKRYYERIVLFCSGFVEIIPLSFILGFYVSFTATRWWQQYMAIPWPDKLMNIIALYVPGSDETSRILRRTLMRYLNLTLVLVLRSISIPVKRRFPTKDHLIEAGFMTKPELEMYSSVPSHEFNTFWIPCTWFVNLLREAKSECRITDSGGLKLIMEEFNDFRSKCGLLWSYDWVSIPLVYTQVVTLSTQAFFLASLLGRQHIHPPGNEKILAHQYGEYYFPIFTLLQFILYMGLLKLGEQLINPFGDDDEDFELNWIIDRHVKVSFLGVDILNADPPPLMKDNYFDETDIKLPYTEAAVAHKVKTYRGSVAAFHVPTDKHTLVIPEFEDEQNNDSDDEDASTTHSSQHQSHKTSVWTVFTRKTKLNDSQSIPSLDSEAMGETGLNPLWRGSIGSVDTQHTDTTTLTTGYGTDRSSQGIRGKTEETKDKEFIITVPSDAAQSQTAGAVNTSSVSSLDAPLLQRSETQSYGSTRVPQVISAHKPSISSLGYAPVEQHIQSKQKSHSFQQIVGEKVVDTLPVHRSHSSANRKVKIPKTSNLKGTRITDPKLRIRPFKSRVTFSEDTKKGDKQEVEKLIYFIPKPQIDNSSSELSEILDVDPSRLKASIFGEESLKYPATHLMVEIPSESGTEKKMSELLLRRQSFDPTMIIMPPTEVKLSQEEEKWLHHQSLPNIQEGQEEETHSDMLTPSPLATPSGSVRRHTSDSTAERRRSFKRQSGSADPDPEVVVAVIEETDPQTEVQKHDLTTAMPLKKKRKDIKPRQSSTESDTGSYHTANSFLMQISEDREELPEFLNTSTSSMDSYSSAVDEPKSGKKDSTDSRPEKTLPKIIFTEPSPSNTSLATDSGSDTKEQKSDQEFDRKGVFHKSRQKSKEDFSDKT